MTAHQEIIEEEELKDSFRRRVCFVPGKVGNVGSGEVTHSLLHA